MNNCRKRTEELWEKHPSYHVSVRMWTTENPNIIFYYQKHSLKDLNSQTQDNSPFTLGIQTGWQLEMMAKSGQNYALSIDATFGPAGQGWVINLCPSCSCLCYSLPFTLATIFKCVILLFIVFSMLFTPILIMKLVFSIVPTLHCYGFRRLEKCYTCRFLYHFVDTWTRPLPSSFGFTPEGSKH